MKVLPRKRPTTAVAAGLLALSMAVVALVHADPSPALPRVRPATLLASTLSALEEPISLSGRTVVSIDLSRPHRQRHPAVGTTASSDQTSATAALQIRRVFRIWRSTDGLRAARVHSFDEQLLVVNPDEAWTWSSATLTAGHLSSSEVSSQPFDLTPSIVADPLTFSKDVLGTVAPYARVSLVDTELIAGRPTYHLSLTSTMRHSRLRRVDLWVDSATRLPLQIELFARAVKDPAISIGFTSIHLGPVDASLFRFTPPPFVTVNEADVFANGNIAASPIADVRVFGRGWKTVVAFRLAQRLSSSAIGSLPAQINLGALVTVRTHGQTWLLTGFASAHRLEGFVPRLS